MEEGGRERIPYFCHAKVVNVGWAATCDGWENCTYLDNKKKGLYDMAGVRYTSTRTPSQLSSSHGISLVGEGFIGEHP